MRPGRFLHTVLVTALAVVFGLALVTPVLAAGRPISITISGAAEAPGPGDPDGSGTASFTFNPGTGEVCYDYTVTGVAPLAAAHIHVAPVGQPGPVVVPPPPTSPTGGTGCVTADRELIVAILRDPSAYYFNVHNADFLAGALRGQLSARKTRLADLRVFQFARAIKEHPGDRGPAVNPLPRGLTLFAARAITRVSRLHSTR